MAKCYGALCLGLLQEPGQKAHAGTPSPFLPPVFSLFPPENVIAGMSISDLLGLK